MTLINKTHPDIINYTGKECMFVSIDEDGMRFSGTTCTMYGFRAKQTVSFINEGNEWKFFVGDDPDGFTLLKDGKKKGLLIRNRPLAKMIMRSLGIKELTRYGLAPTGHEYSGMRLYEIITRKTYTDLMKDLQN
jgi:hypothetical protein